MPAPGPLAALRRHHDLGETGPVRRIVTHAPAETRTVEWAADGLSLIQRFPRLTSYEWADPGARTLTLSYTPHEEQAPDTWVHLTHFDEAGRPVREEEGPRHALREVAQRVFDGEQLVSASVYEQVSDGDLGWVESTVLPQPPQEGGVRREEVTSSYPDGLITIELREYDAAGREVYNESYSNLDDICEVSRTTYQDDDYGHWTEMRIEASSNRPGSEKTYIHRREIEYRAPDTGEQ
ncbi:hypothetical protein [Deinococcus radiodurans]|uniref:Uncharacterized protein n=1 Tax=Deinococcus radiodurans (strain ATCC 13939 / DSM 20539 / JCM 16871 / CCUG 27074 / LMG 4051 / NBRC 15346 / NCIMB 9279 / VKM B-1422 / R1) TaxID=243230 RepID=Q9RSU5_DEIRA|nr:hypothetical protein [Deinococcus radiodurans]AAF11580.1 hypothetical protein DR_2027 [Deinococcus radiodurans R1 = ATCC 13939 = DSM 20539]ANC70898.1 hypothetical protein A2G07_03490 [Deinococcus radiodurans R1 = ATCC 13939 = DSM 20539]QEM71421.1 hypothetical protein DXG80_06355 [Deinococcus radiodurans]QIP29956.1 hypothetical protein HAV23_13035 [Deinococcus radiodurans]QIP31368.1 hypothetical protein HAV35_03750 [Deinococcus radiodurans]